MTFPFMLGGLEDMDMEANTWIEIEKNSESNIYKFRIPPPKISQETL